MKNIDKELYVYGGLALVLGAAFGLLTSIIYQKNIPLSLIIGGIIGLLIGALVWFLFFKNTNIEKNEKDF